MAATIALCLQVFERDRARRQRERTAPDQQPAASLGADWRAALCGAGSGRGLARHPALDTAPAPLGLFYSWSHKGAKRPSRKQDDVTYYFAREKIIARSDRKGLAAWRRHGCVHHSDLVETRAQLRKLPLRAPRVRPLSRPARLAGGLSRAGG
jgi:hypothetical protein